METMQKIFTVDTQSLIYSFDDLPLSNIVVIEEIFHFKRAQIKRNPSRFDDITASGGVDYFIRAASYLLLACDEHGVTTGKADPKMVRRFVESLKGADVERLEECMRDFFHRRKLSDLASDVHSRDFLTLEELVSLGTKARAAVSSESSRHDVMNSVNEQPSPSPVLLTDE